MFERFRDFRGVGRKAWAVDIARAGKVDVEFLPDAARIWRKQNHAAPQASRFPDIVRHEDNRLFSSRPDSLEIAVELFAGHGIQGPKRFVHQEHARIWRQRTGQRHALAHSAGEFVNVGTGVAFQADEFDVKVRHFHALLAGQVWLEFQSEEDVPQHVEPGEKRRFLEHHHAIPAGLRDDLSVRLDFPRIGEFQSRDHVKKRGLAATTRPDETDKLPFVHRKVDVVERLSDDHSFAECLRHPLQ